MLKLYVLEGPGLRWTSGWRPSAPTKQVRQERPFKVRSRQGKRVAAAY